MYHLVPFRYKSTMNSVQSWLLFPKLYKSIILKALNYKIISFNCNVITFKMQISSFHNKICHTEYYFVKL